MDIMGGYTYSTVGSGRAIHTFHTQGSLSGYPLVPRPLLRCIQMRSVPGSQWKVFSSSQELRVSTPVCGAKKYILFTLLIGVLTFIKSTFFLIFKQVFFFVFELCSSALKPSSILWFLKVVYFTNFQMGLLSLVFGIFSRQLLVFFLYN